MRINNFFFEVLIKKENFLFLLSFILCAFGQPAWIGFLGLITSFCGYTIFWSQIIKKQTTKKRFLYSFIWSLCVQAVGLSWMASVKYQGYYILLVYLFVVCAISIQFSFITILIPVNKKISFSRIGLISSLAVIFEWSRMFFFSGFTWNPIGISMSYYNVAIQFVSIFGIYGLTFWVTLTNLLGLRAVTNKRSYKSYSLWIIVFLIPYVHGYLHIKYHNKNDDVEKVNVLLVQTSIMPEERDFFPENKNFIHPLKQWERILSFLPKENNDIDLIVLPEGALPFSAYIPIYSLDSIKYLFSSNYNIDVGPYLPKDKKPYVYFDDEKEPAYSNAFICQLISNYYNCPLVIGLDAYEGKKSYNAAYYFEPKKNKANYYCKQVLVPIGEYFPFEWCADIAKRYGIYGSFSKGNKPRVFKSKVPISVSICYEETYGYLMRKGKLLGAKLFVNITNDVWFINSKLPKQHFYLGRIRAIENGIPLVRACNTGVTAGVDCFGNIIKELKSKHEDCEKLKGSIKIDLLLKTYDTLYSKYADFPLVVFCFLFICLDVFYMVYKKKKKI